MVNGALLRSLLQTPLGDLRVHHQALQQHPAHLAKGVLPVETYGSGCRCRPINLEGVKVAPSSSIMRISANWSSL